MAGLSYRSGVFLVLLAGSIWSTSGLMVRLIHDAQVWQILFYRSVAMTPVLFIVITFRSHNHFLNTIRKAAIPSTVGAIGLVFAYAGGIFSLQATTVANAVFLFATAPFFAAVLSRILLSEKVRRATWIAIAFAGIGMLIMLWGGLASGRLIGNVAAVLSAIGFAVFTICLRWGKLEDMLPAVFLSGIITFFTAFMMCRFLELTLSLSLWDTSVALLMGAFQLGLGLTLYTFGSRVLPAAELALLSMTEVMLGPVWVWIIMGELAGAWTVAGGAILLASIAGNAISGIRQVPPKLI